LKSARNFLLAFNLKIATSSKPVEMPQRWRMVAANQYLLLGSQIARARNRATHRRRGPPENPTEENAMAKYTFVVMTNPNPGKEAEYNEW
jgi:hypothetical protein